MTQFPCKCKVYQRDKSHYNSTCQGIFVVSQESPFQKGQYYNEIIAVITDKTGRFKKVPIETVQIAKGVQFVYPKNGEPINLGEQFF